MLHSQPADFAAALAAVTAKETAQSVACAKGIGPHKWQSPDQPSDSEDKMIARVVEAHVHINLVIVLHSNLAITL